MNDTTVICACGKSIMHVLQLPIQAHGSELRHLRHTTERLASLTGPPCSLRCCLCSFACAAPVTASGLLLLFVPAYLVGLCVLVVRVAVEAGVEYSSCQQIFAKGLYARVRRAGFCRLAHQYRKVQLRSARCLVTGCLSAWRVSFGGHEQGCAPHACGFPTHTGGYWLQQQEWDLSILLQGHCDAPSCVYHFM